MRNSSTPFTGDNWCPMPPAECAPDGGPYWAFPPLDLAAAFPNGAAAILWAPILPSGDMAEDAEQKPKRGRGRGRPKFEATDEMRGMVRAYVECGYGERDICGRLGIKDPKTLRKHFRKELDFAAMDFFSAVIRSLGRQAIGAPAQHDAHGNLLRAEIPPNVGAACFIAKCRGKKLGWSERHEVTGADGAPLFDQPDFSEFTDDEIAQYIALNKKAAARNGNRPGGTGAGSSEG